MSPAVNKNNAKRAQVDKDKTLIFAIVSVAAFIVVAALMMSKGLWSQANYYGSVADKKEIAVKQLETNLSAVNSLQAAYNSFKNQDPNLIGGSSTGTADRDGDNARLVLDALPSKYDFPALATSLERLLLGYDINGITGNDDSVAQSGAAAGSVIEMPFTVDVNTNYDNFKNLINTFDRSIRPLSISRIDFRGTNGDLQVGISAKTFYQPEKGLEITSEVVQ